MLIDVIKRFWTRSIQRQLILGIALVHAVLMTIFVVDLVERQRNFLSEQTVAQTQSLSETLAANSVSWVLANDVIGLEEVIVSQSGYPGLEYAMVLSPDGRVLAHTNLSVIGRFATDDISQGLLKKTVTTQLLQTNIKLVDIATPIMVNDSHIGWARVGVSGDKVSEGLEIITRDGVVYTIIAILIGTLFALFMAKGITSGLHQLVVVASSIREGTKTRVKLEREDELGQLANDFNLMLDEIDRQNRSRLMLEQEVRAQRDQLEVQVRERTSQLEVARDEALRATAAKSEFLASMSHELRTPLNSIIGFTGIVRDGEAGDINDEQKNQLSMVYNSAKHLLGLINDILDLSKVEAGKHEIVKGMFSLPEMLNEVKEMIQPLVDEKGLSLQVQSTNIDEQLYADQVKLRQIIVNLLGNAVKFTYAGTISLRCEIVDDVLTISVIDTGIGIDSAGQLKIFQPFSQVDGGDTRLQEGTGLGLAICKRFIDLMGGKLTLESVAGEGSTFTVTLPIELPKSISKHKQQKRHSAVLESNNSLVMVVDDQHDAQELLKRYLRAEGYDVIVCSNGNEAVELARTHKPFAITLDIMMPKLNGWDTLSMLKGDEETLNIPVIIISILDEANLGISLGAVDYLQKPVESKDLVRSLNNLRETGDNVLIVEDHDEDAELLRKILEPMNYDIRHASDGATALTEVKKKCPDIVLLDLMMPGMSGFEVIRRIRGGDYPECDVQIIVISAKTLTEAEGDYLNKNVEQVMVKGQFSRKEVLSEVGCLLNKLGSTE